MRALKCKRLLFYIPILIAIIKLCIAPYIELGNDEVYYFTYAQKVQLSYFDHAPLLGWVLYVFTFGASIASELLMRLPAILFCLLNSYIIYYWIQSVYNKNMALCAMLLYNANIYTGFIAGFFILPDSVQLTPWILALYYIQQATIKKQINTILALKIGLFVGLATLAKYHGLVLGLGFLLFALIYARYFFVKWQFYMSAVLCLVISLPIFVWNYSNAFISFSFHNGRVGAGNSINWNTFFQFNLGQVLYQNPFVFILIVWALLIAFKNRKVIAHKNIILLYTAFPLILLPTISSLSKTTLPHWSGPAFIGLMLLTCAFIYKRKMFHMLLFTSIFIFISGLLSFPIIVNNNVIKSKPKYDFTLDLYGWNKSAGLLKINLESKKIDINNVLIISDNWFPGGHLNFYWQAKNGIPVMVDGQLNDIHHFDWLNKERELKFDNKALYFYTSDKYPLKTESLKSFTIDENKKPIVIDVLKGEKLVNNVRLLPIVPK